MSVRHEPVPVVGLDGFNFQMDMLRQGSETTLKCDMCGNTVTRDNATPQEIAEQAYFNHSWRAQNGLILCAFCTDDKR